MMKTTFFELPVLRYLAVILPCSIIAIQPAAYAELGIFACSDPKEIQLQKISVYESEKNSVFNQMQSTYEKQAFMPLLNLAETSFQDFTRSHCSEYLFESAFLYKNYYERRTHLQSGKYPINHSTRNEYRIWTQRFQELPSSESQQSLLASRPKDFFLGINQFRNDFAQEKARVERLVKHRDVGLGISIATLVTGVSLTIIGSVIQSFDGKLSDGYDCSFGRLPTRCRFQASPGSGVMIGFGIAMTIGGATGIGISMHQASKYSSPASN